MREGGTWFLRQWITRFPKISYYNTSIFRHHESSINFWMYTADIGAIDLSPTL